MGSIVFVHGTGVRKEAYQKTCALVEKRLLQYAPGWKLVECLWGDECGVKLNLMGKSVPDYKSKAADAENNELMRWWTLYHDPYCELRAMAVRDGAPPSARRGRNANWRELDETIKAFKPSSELQRELSDIGLDAFWDDAFDKVRGSSEYKEAIKFCMTYPGQFRKTVARAVFAKATQAALEMGVPVAAGEMRDGIITRVVGELGGEDKALREVGQAILGGLKTIGNIFAIGAATTAAYSGVLSRGKVTDSSLPASGDILLYQTRGQAIRDFIKKKIAAATPPVYVLSHSLGGIACVDLLVEERLEVKGLITAGSQAPLLYEMNCLASLSDGALLPRHFPAWINFYDRNDLLSYVGERVFPERVRDVEIVSHQPFPQAHSAYWSSPRLWRELAQFIE